MANTQLEALKAKLAALNPQDNRGDGQTRSTYKWKPSEGKNQIRILPNKFSEPGNPFTELYFYYDFGKTWLSPACQGKPDPVIEFCSELSAKTGLTKEEWGLNQKIKRKILPKQRFFVPILIRGKEEEGVKFYEFGITVYNLIKAIIDDPDYGDISDLETGRDITIDYTPPKTKDGRPEVSVVAKPRETVATTDKDLLKKIEDMLDISTQYTVPGYEELKTACETYLSGNPVETKPKSETSDAPKSTSVKVDHDATNQGFEVQKPESKPDTSQDIDDILAQFDDILEKR